MSVSARARARVCACLCLCLCVSVCVRVCLFSEFLETFRLSDRESSMIVHHPFDRILELVEPLDPEL